MDCFPFSVLASGPASVAPATGTTTRKADGTECAHVLRFDWESGSWLPETIEIPQLGTGTAELSEGLKVLIGAGTNMDKCRELSIYQTTNNGNN